MKLQPDKTDVQSISGYGPGWVGINGARVERSVILGARGERLDWQCARFEDLLASHFEQIAALKPELVIFGSGTRLRFAAPALHRCLMQARIGIETMDTLAACRTYNILAGEGRHVIAALLLEQAALQEAP